MTDDNKNQPNEHNEHNDDDRVDILEDEKDLVLDHNYDGIKELDHPLPLWWTFLFIGTVVFSIPYYFYYTHADGPSIRAGLDEEMAKIEKLQAEYEAKAGGFNVEKYNSFVATDEAEKLGEKAYNRNCAACHGAQGGGTIGPNLTDAYWMHGDGDLASVYGVIAKGVTSKGMPAWKQTLNEEEMMAVTAYVMKLKGTNVAGKEPQGELIE